jgi:Hydantoinase/oxoprolinase N-terminal region
MIAAFPDRSCRLGVCVHRDRYSAALVDSDGTVLASIERPTTTPAVTLVLGNVVDELMAQAGPRGITLDHIAQCMIAVSEIDGLAGLPGADPSWRRWPGQLGPVAVVRLGAATTALPPLAAWPPELRAAVSIAETTVAGGARLDGSDFEPLDTAALVAFAREIAGKVGAVAVSSVFAAVAPKHELVAAGLLRAELGDSVPILLSHESDGIGLLERENAAALQAALIRRAWGAAHRLRRALVDCGLSHAEPFMARNDGSIMTVDYGLTRPLLMHGAAAATGARGAALLAGEQEALVAFTDVEGQPTAVCAVTAGSAELAPAATMIAGVPTGLRMVALVDTEPPLGGTGSGLSQLAEAIDRAKSSPRDLPLLVVGPGAEKLVDTLPGPLPGTTLVCCPPRADAAGAVGVAIAPVSGEAVRMFSADNPHGDDIRDRVREQARAAAVHAGADPATVAVTDVQESVVSYVSEPTVQLRVRAEGPPRVGWRRTYAPS